MVIARNPDPLSREPGTYKTVRTRFWSWRSGEVLSCSLLGVLVQVVLERNPDIPDEREEEDKWLSPRQAPNPAHPNP